MSKNGKPTVVFYTAENARKKDQSKGKVSKNQKKSPPKPTPEALASIDLYTGLFDSENNPLVCIYSKYVKLSRVDVSSVTRDEDRLVNAETVPLVAFFKKDGTCTGYLAGNKTNGRSYCQEVDKLLRSEGVDVQGIADEFRKLLQGVRTLVKKQYKADQDLAYARRDLQEYQRKAQKKAQKQAKKGTTRTTSSTKEAATSPQEEKLKKCQAETTEIKDQLTALKAEISTLVKPESETK